MKAYRSSRAPVPAVVTAVGLVVVSMVAQLLNHLLNHDDVLPPGRRGPYWKWLLAGYNLFYGVDPLQADTTLLLANAVAVVVLLLVGFLLAWWALRSLAPGSGVLPAFLSLWAVGLVATLAANLARFGDLTLALPGDNGGGAGWYSMTVDGAVAGVRFGFVVALLGTLAWLAVRPKPVPDTPPAPARPAREEPEPPWVRDPATGGVHRDDAP